ncbi:MAG: hypothetical protein IT328_23355 [Caldilineaceae bacterium]|nr:hypothetical protein [Caldilineaceae bacterium]
MDIWYLLFFCPQYRPLLLVLVGLLILTLFLTMQLASSKQRKASSAVRDSLSEYANRFAEVQRSAYDRRAEAANSFVDDVNNILGGKQL